MLYKPISKLLKTHGISGYVCGNTARDLYMGVTPVKHELAVRSTIQQLRTLFIDKLIEVNEYDTTVTIEYMGKQYILFPTKKITMVNTYYNFEYTDSLEEDSKCRDFTCTSLYYDAIEEQWFDYSNGKSDIDNKIIRMPGNPKERILESKIRLLRAPILCAILGDGWQVDTESQTAIKEYRLKVVPLHPKQINEELCGLFTYAEKPSKAFKLMRSMRLLENFFPELNETIDIEQSNKAVHLDLFNHIMLTIDAVPKDKPNSLKVRIAALLHDIAKPYTEIRTDTGVHFYNHENIGAILAERILQRWGFAKTFSDNIILLIKHHLFDASPTISTNSIKRLIPKVGEHNIHDLLELRIADRLGTGRKDISMTKIYAFRDKINFYLAGHAPESFKLQISDNAIRQLLSKYTDSIDESLPEVKRFLKSKIISGRVSNIVTSLKRIFHKTAKINCPLDKAHLFKIWTDIETDSVERFPNGNITCGIYCNFVCNKLLQNHK
ncbi:MAG TPA: HD domain-containing protein [Bacteroidales bacterium]|nr:HD domain-containing protein [Bacteroidales bacterium]